MITVEFSVPCVELQDEISTCLRVARERAESDRVINRLKGLADLLENADFYGARKVCLDESDMQFIASYHS
jgi:hypothetical protein